ncbi:hypothetical protein L208DRAFT_1405744 [Tricholoma matsutake]|nr:hypothetical protein L208DRAFT_1405744 [Tricholoma matsutake 945]
MSKGELITSNPGRRNFLTSSANRSPHLAFPILSFNRDHLFIHDPTHSSSLSADTVVAHHPHHKGSGGSG